jgi:uncharacterized membrane protein YcaP (DUF421 family)
MICSNGWKDGCMWSSLVVGPAEALNVVLSALGIYCTFLILIRLLGQRTMATMSSFDLAAVIAMGAVGGRAVLGYTPTLAAGAIGLATLFTLQAAAGQLRRSRLGESAVTNRPVLLMAGDEILHENLARAHIVEEELHAKLPLAGIRNTSEVGCVVLESTGAVSVLRCGELIDPALLAAVKDADRLPARLIRLAPEEQ